MFTYNYCGELIDLESLTSVSGVQNMPRNKILKSKFVVHSDKWMLGRELYFNSLEKAQEAHAIVTAIHKFKRK